MEFQKVASLVNNSLNQPSKFKVKNWVEINDGLHGTCNRKSRTKFKNSKLHSSLCDYIDACIYIKGVITVPNSGTEAKSNYRHIKVILKAL